ncbi:MAG: redoxin domain-containing protein [Ferruginibacter sp.]
MKYFFICLLSFHVFYLSAKANDYPTLPIGSPAPGFNLRGTDQKMYSLQSFASANVLVIIFTCNHCPTAQAYEDRIKQLVTDYKLKGAQVVAISPNDPKSVRLDELGYTDYGDSYEEMRLRARDKAFNFPYLYDGDTEATSKKYGPVATPHVFIFDKKRILQYSGRIDDVENPAGTPKNNDTRNAIEALLSGRPVPVPVTKTFGCSIKWNDKQELVKKGLDDWAKEPVTIQPINEEGVRKLLKNDSGKLRLINVWATWCGPCIIELPDFVNINRMYRGRDFEMATICADRPAKKARALEILTRLQVSSANYIFNADDIYKLIELVDPKWQGALPYTLLVEPGGKIIYAKQGGIQPMFLKKKIVDHPLIGRVY